MKIWIDLANSPHPLLFEPIGRAFREQGHSVLVTSRDNAETLELARERWPDVESIGSPSPKGRLSKAVAIAHRVRQLRGWAKRSHPDVALSHNSYAQIAASYSLRLPIVTAMDYEHQPANHLAFRLADRILLPEALPLQAVRRQGASSEKVRHYPGFKEEIYLGDFDPDPEILSKIGIVRDPDTVVVVMRAPPMGAMYHQFDNPTFNGTLSLIAGQSTARCIVLARDPAQREALVQRGLPNCVVPLGTLDSRSLLYAADLFVGAGGTMTREAALMGIPTLSTYAGAAPVIEQLLERRGLLSRIDTARLDGVRRREREPVDPAQLRVKSAALIDVFVDETLKVAR
jgi:predicted glycosyltransferase